MRDFSEYNLAEFVEYKQNRIVLYRENTLHSGIITPEVSRNAM